MKFVDARRETTAVGPSLFPAQDGLMASKDEIIALETEFLEAREEVCALGKKLLDA